MIEFKVKKEKEETELKVKKGTEGQERKGSD